LGEVQDDMAILAALGELWERVTAVIPSTTKIMRVSVTLGELTLDTARQPDLFANDDKERQRCEALSRTMDGLNSRFGQTVVSVGPWAPPAGGNVGSKISYTRIPEAEDNW
jgi:DNA polymerase-4